MFFGYLKAIDVFPWVGIKISYLDMCVEYCGNKENTAFYVSTNLFVIFRI